MSRRDSAEATTAKALGVTVLVGAGGFLLYYLLSGAGSENDAPLIPNALERHLDQVVDGLNQRFGKRWVNAGISALEAALYGVLPPNVVGLVRAVHEAERIGARKGLSGNQKKQHAIRVARSLGFG